MVDMIFNDELKEYIKDNITDEYTVDKYGIVHWVEPCALVV